MEEIQIALDSDNLELAEQLCNELLSENEYDTNGLHYKAIVMRKKNLHDEAIELHNSLINLLPNLAENYAERGLTYHLIKEKELALADFNKAVDLEPDNGYRYSSRAFIRDYYGEHQAALKDYAKAIELDPNDAIALNNMGVIEEKLGRLDDAKQSFDKSDKLSGIDQRINTISQTDNSGPINKEEQVQQKLTFSSFVSTIKSLFTSSQERKNFIKFLGGKK